MKQHHKKAIRANARAALAAANVAVGQDFHTLSTTQVETLMTDVSFLRYQHPKKANGSKARYFHDRLQRQAQIKE